MSTISLHKLYLSCSVSCFISIRFTRSGLVYSTSWLIIWQYLINSFLNIHSFNWFCSKHQIETISDAFLLIFNQVFKPYKDNRSLFVFGQIMPKLIELGPNLRLLFNEPVPFFWKLYWKIIQTIVSMSCCQRQLEQRYN